jgi:nucleoside phosphorylase
MNLLIVDDSDQKARQVEELLRKSVPDLRIERAKSFRSAVRFLESTTYDLLILDLMLPIRDGDAPTEQGGKQVLAEVLDGTGCRHPSHIVCLTAFDEMAEALRDEAKRKLVHLVIYDEIEGAWQTPLAEKAKAIEAMLQETRFLPKDYKTDLAIVTSSPRVELQEILKISELSPEYNQADLLHYFVGKWPRAGGASVSVIACAAPSMGMTAACVTACKVIERWRPRYLAMTGIAAGTKKDDQKFGDILVAEAAYDYGSGKIAETENGRVFIASPSQLRMEPSLHAIVQKWERDQLQMDEIRKAWYEESVHNPRLIVGLLASGAAVVQDQGLVDDILSKSRKVVGLDMEAYAIFQAGYLASHPRPTVIVAKSVSDFADKSKDDKWQRYAAFTSARFIYEFFTTADDLSIENRKPAEALAPSGNDSAESIRAR